MTNPAITGGEPGQVPEETAGAGAPVRASGHGHRHHVLRRTRVGGVWVAVALFALVLLLLLIFILQNGHQVDISFFGAHGHLPLGVALLLAAVLGVLLVVIPGTGRIVQLRMTARRHRRIDASADGYQTGGTLADGSPDVADPADPADPAPISG